MRGWVGLVVVCAPILSCGCIHAEAASPSGVGSSLTIKGEGGSVLGVRSSIRGGSRSRAVGVVSSLAEAFAAAYSNNPSLQGARARLRAAGADVSSALAGWRPVVTMSGSAGRVSGNMEEAYPSQNFFGQVFLSRQRLKETRNQALGELTVTQPIWRGGKTAASVDMARRGVEAARFGLREAEQSVFLEVVKAYVAVVEDRLLLGLARRDGRALSAELRDVREEVRQGAVTEVSVDQARAAFLGSRSDVISLQGRLAADDAVFRQMVGADPNPNSDPGGLGDPQPLRLPGVGLAGAVDRAAGGSPGVKVAEYRMRMARSGVIVARSALKPRVSVQASAFDQSNPSGPYSRNQGAQVMMDVTVPLYQGGRSVAGVDRAEAVVGSRLADLGAARRRSMVDVRRAWFGVVADRRSLGVLVSAVRADRLALVGVMRQQVIGTRTTIDVLRARRRLVSDEARRIKVAADLVDQSYAVRAVLGELTRGRLGVGGPGLTRR